MNETLECLVGEHEFILRQIGDTTLFVHLCIAEDSHGLYFSIRRPNGKVDTYLNLVSAAKAF